MLKNCHACQEFNDLSHGFSSWTWSAACRKSSGVLAQNCTTNGLASQHQNILSFQWDFNPFQCISFHVKMQGYANACRCFHSDIVQVVTKQVWSGQNLDCNVPLTAHTFWSLLSQESDISDQIGQVIASCNQDRKSSNTWKLNPVYTGFWCIITWRQQRSFTGLHSCLSCVDVANPCLAISSSELPVQIQPKNVSKNSSA